MDFGSKLDLARPKKASLFEKTALSTKESISNKVLKKKKNFKTNSSIFICSEELNHI